MKVTRSLLKMGAAMLAAPDERYWGYQLSKTAHVQPGAMYRRLTLMLEAGWLDNGWQTPEEAHGKPARRYYTLTEKGKTELQKILDSNK